MIKILRFTALFIVFTLTVVTLPSYASPAASQAGEITPVVVNYLLADTQVDIPPPPTPVFGATRVSEVHRPSRNWLSAFSSQAPVPLSGSLQDAIDNCPNNTPCVIEIDQLVLNSTVFINRSNIKLLGKINNKITFTGTGALFFVESNVNDLVFEGLNIDGRLNGASVERDPDIYGIYLGGTSIQNVLIIGNSIQHLDGKEGAHGIAALGSGGSDATALSNIIIDNNTLSNLRTGFSESIVVNGNVRQWEIVNNTVSDVNNIAIDAIGGEGTSPTQVVNGRVLPGEFDAARYGFIENNTVTNMSTLTNPAYNSQHSFAAGIYIDGGRDIVVSNNIVTNTPWAFELGAENCVATSNITVEDNQSSQSRYGDLLIGGYADNGYIEHTTINCNPTTSSDVDEGHGYVRFATVKSNNFDSSNVEESVVQLSKRIRNTVILHAGITSVNTNGIVSGDENSIRIQE